MNYLIDGTVDFSGGQNSGLSPDRIAKNQFYKGVNVTTKNGTLSPRDSFIHIPIKVITEGKELGVSYQELFDRGKFQGERAYQADQDSYVISVRSGIIFQIDLKRRVATVLRTATDDRVSRYHRRVNIIQAGKYMVIFDWPNQPIYIFNGIAKRTDYYAKDSKGLPLPQIPQSRLGVFLQSRLWIANSQNEFTAGDPVISSNPLAPLTFAEVLTPNAPFVGQVFNLGYGFGTTEISAMGFISSRNSQSKIQATNYGPLYVATRKSLHIYDAELPRTQWLNGAFGRLELWNTGIVGQRAHSIIGSDVLFQDVYGHVHSLTKNQNDERSGWATTNISREVYSSWIDSDVKEYLDIGFITYHNNRVYIGVKPSKISVPTYFGRTVYDYYHQGMVVLELDNVSTIGGAAAPVWAGLWTGIRPMEATSVDNQLYITSKDLDGFNRTYLVDPTQRYNSWNGIKRPTRSRVYFRAFDHEQPFIEKVEHSVDVTIGRLQEPLELFVYRKPLHTFKWALWDTFKFNPKCPVQEDCSTIAPQTSAGFKGLFFAEVKETVCNVQTNESGREYRETQLMIDVEGADWEVFKIKLKGRVDGEPESEGRLCDVKNNVLPVEDCKFKSDWEIDSVCPMIQSTE